MVAQDARSDCWRCVCGSCWVFYLPWQSISSVRTGSRGNNGINWYAGVSWMVDGEIGVGPSRIACTGRSTESKSVSTCGAFGNCVYCVHLDGVNGLECPSQT